MEPSTPEWKCAKANGPMGRSKGSHAVGFLGPSIPPGDSYVNCMLRRFANAD